MIFRALALGVAASALAACAQIGPSTVLAPDDGGTGIARNASLAPTQIAALDNLSKGEILARLGQPDFTRRDPPAEIWQYRSVGCVLDLFLYPEGAGDDLHVAHAVSRNPKSVQTPTDSCSPFPSTKPSAAS